MFNKHNQMNNKFGNNNQNNRGNSYGDYGNQGHNSGYQNNDNWNNKDFPQKYKNDKPCHTTNIINTKYDPKITAINNNHYHGQVGKGGPN
jgi:hypothetical protein